MLQPDGNNVKTSVRVLQLIILLTGLIVLGRLFFLQIISYDTYNPLSQRNALQQKIVNPARGLIYDRNGSLLVDNVPIYTITITPNQFDTSKIGLLADLCELDVNDLRASYQKARSYSWHKPSRLLTEVNFAIFTKIEENLWQLPGIGHSIESKRNYPYEGIQGTHIFGYLSEVTQRQYRESDTYQLGDKAGKTGLEYVYEDYLRGQPGLSYIQVNALGQPLGSYNNGELDVAPVKGADLITSLDAELQKLTEELFINKTGAAVALDPNTGEILAFNSAPGFDLNQLAGKLDPKFWAAVNQDTLRPLFNRAISSIQPPGSTFKPLMGMIGLELGLITANENLYNPGYFTRGRRYNDLAPPGDYNLSRAITKSSNTYFFSLMNEIASNRLLNEWNRLAGAFGLGQRLGIDLPDEKAGILADSAYYDRAFGKRRWGIGDLISLGVGQGTLSVTPLQMAVVAAAIANKGNKVQPHIVRQIKHPEGRITYRSHQNEPIEWVQDMDFEPIIDGMKGVVREGSAIRSYVRQIEMGGKTGTAQNPHGEDHGWFIGFAPADNPQIVVAILVENRGFASRFAAPIGTLMMQYYLDRTIYRQDLYKQMLATKPPKNTEDGNYQNSKPVNDTNP